MNPDALLTHSEFVRGLAVSLVFAREDPEDIVQETWLKALSRPPRPGPEIRGWFATVVRNSLRQSRRSRLRRAAREHLAARNEAVPSTAELRERESVRRQVVDAVLALEEPYRSVVVFRYYEDLPPRKIAARMGLPVETVKTRLKRALSMLRARLDEKHGRDRRTWGFALLPLTGIGLGGLSVTVGFAAVAVAVLAVGLAAVLSVQPASPGGPGAPDAPPVLASGAGDLGGAATGTPGGSAAGTAAGEADAPANGILVLGQDGRPARARVLTTPEVQADLMRAVTIGSTKADGLLPAERFQRDVRKFVWARSYDHDAVAGPVEWSPGGLVLRLSRGCVLNGTVRRPDGSPVPGALTEIAREVFTDRQGRFRYEGLFPNTPYELTVSVPGFSRGDRGVLIERVTFEPGEREKSLDLVLDIPVGPAVLVSVSAAPSGAERGRFFLKGVVRNGKRIALPSHVLVFLADIPMESVQVAVRAPGCLEASAEVAVPVGPELSEVKLDLVAGGAPARGRVVHASGEPAAGVSIHACKTVGLLESGSAEAKTGEDGTFDITSRMRGHHLLAVEKGKSVSGWLELTPETEEVVLVLGEGGIVRGRVVDAETKEPVPGARVELSLGHHDHFPEEWHTDADARGEYRFGGVPLRTLLIPGVQTGYRASRGFDRDDLVRRNSGDELVEAGYAGVLERPGEVFDRDLETRAAQGRECELRIVFPAGSEPERQLTVFHLSSNAFGSVSSDRRVEVDPEDPRIRLFLPQGESEVRVSSRRLWSPAITVEVKEEGPPIQATARLRPRTRFFVRLVDEEGRPIERRDAQISVRQGRPSGGAGSLGTVPTDSRGRAEVTDILPSPAIAAEEGAKVLFIVSMEGRYAGDSHNPNLSIPAGEYLRLVTGAEGTPVDLDVPVAEFMPVRAVVVDRRGSPVGGVEVRVQPEECFLDERYVSDRDGALELRFLGESRRRSRSWSDPILSALPPWSGTLDLDDAMRDVALGRKPDIRLVVRRAREIVVTLVDEEGRALPGVIVERRVWALRDNEERIADEEGRIRLSLPEGEKSIDLAARGYLDVSLKIEPGRKDYTATLLRVVEFRVEVVTPEGYPGGWVHLTALDPDTEDELGFGDIDPDEGRGSVTLELPPRRTLIRGWGADGFWEGEAVWSGDTESVRLVLSARTLHPVVFRVLDGEAVPVARVAVRVELGGGGASLARTYLTDDRGEILVELPAGDYSRPRLQVAGHRVVESPDGVTVPGGEALVVTVKPERSQSFLIDCRKAEGVDPMRVPVEVRLRGPDGTTGGITGRSRTASNGHVFIGIDMPEGIWTMEITCREQRFTFEFPGHPVKPPVFELR